ncbi:MAG: apolipoprotein N-acyltransferase [Treponema sp.]|nr:apolipoprotein N-acyltransferase [Candidatus Treponema merdequi]
MEFYKKVILELLSAVLFSVSIPNEYLIYGSAFTGLFALVPHFTALKNSTSIKESCILCFIQCITTHLLSSWWLGLFEGFALFTLGASAIGTGLIHSVFGIFFFLPKYIHSLKAAPENIRIKVSNPCFTIIWFTAVYTVFEFVKCTGFLAYPWGTLPLVTYNAKFLSQIVDLAGTRLITFIYSLFAAGAAVYFDEWNKNRKTVDFQPALGIALIFAVSVFYGIFQYTKVRIPQKYINTVFIQQNADPWKMKDDRQSILVSEELTGKAVYDMHRKGFNPDLIVWSEGILRFPLPEGMIHYNFFPEESPLLNFIKEYEVPFIIGGPYSLNFDNLEFYNSAIVFNKDASLKGYYAKTQLVPFAEYIPFTKYKIVQTLLLKLAGFARGWVPGNAYKTFDVECQNADGSRDSALISIPICFEDAFGECCRGLKKAGSELFINITDDSWSLTKSAEYQHYVISWFRSMEFRTTLVRSTNSGVTAVIDPSGKVLADLPLFEKNYLNFEVPLYSNTKTLYCIFGEWLSFILVIFIAFYTISAILFTEKSLKNTRAV